jgi:hypothetical protein
LVEFFVLDFMHWEKLKKCDLKMVKQDEKAEDITMIISDVIQKCSDKSITPDLKMIETVMRWNVQMNINSAKNNDLNVFMEAFVKYDGIKLLASLLILNYDTIVMETSKCLPVIFEYTKAHDYIK